MKRHEMVAQVTVGERVTVDITGVVQGVGFRPTLRVLAEEAGLSGWVQNRSGSVRLFLDGRRDNVERFLSVLPSRLPLRARLDRLTVIDRKVYRSEPEPWRFEIRSSEADEAMRISIPADLGSCEACFAEVFEPASRYYRYPFTTCTDCGPRYTVVTGMPYDRNQTTLADFPLCPACKQEYGDPRNRRFHAQSMACPACGPHLQVHDKFGAALSGDPIRLTRKALAHGQVIAVRGLGGFQLMVNGREREAVLELRRRKHRPHKPLAVMARDIDTIKRICHLPPAAEALLSGPERPIVVCDLKPAAYNNLPLPDLSPDAATLGVMLPTTPLHALLFSDPETSHLFPPFDWLVATSGNRRSEPICISNQEAKARLAEVADLIVSHDREINLRNDDSLAALQLGRPQLWRRARGYVPDPLPLAHALARPVLAMGGELKNTMALGINDQLILSPHIGDLSTPEAVSALEQMAGELPRYFGHAPAVIAVDLHPDMEATRLGRCLAEHYDIPLMPVQHHHAHASAAMAEYGLGSALALVFDGTGLGPDGSIWGAELLHVVGADYQRLATFAPVALPGGDQAVREPLRQLVACMAHAGCSLSGEHLACWGIDPDRASVWQAQIRHGINAPLSHAAGRLFDSVAAALGLAPGRITYEAQAAVRLESAARRVNAPAGSFHIKDFFTCRLTGDCLQIDWRPLFYRLAGSFVDHGNVTAQPNADGVAEQAWGFHWAVAQAACAMARQGREATGQNAVVLSGGVFMNRLLTELVVDLLEKAGFSAFIHRRLPPNDGGVAAGQAMIAGG